MTEPVTVHPDSAVASSHMDAGGDDARIPVTLLTGFLGAGKTTLLNHLVKQPAMAGTAVLINEFGAVGIDHHLVESRDETMVVLESGCVCCTMRGDLVAALKDLHGRLSRREIPEVKRVVIETTGLADPVPVVWTLMEERFVAARFRCDGVITAVDANLGAAQLDRHAEARRQVALADRILVTKTDQVDRSARELLEVRLAELNPAASRIGISHGAVDPALICGAGPYAPGARLDALAQWLGLPEEEGTGAQAAPVSVHDPAQADGAGEASGEAVTSFPVYFDRPVPWRGFAVTLGAILTEYGTHVLRIKGLMNVSGLGTPVVVQCVGAVAYPPAHLPRWPGKKGRFDMRGRLVFIVAGLSQAEVELIRARLLVLPDDGAALRAAARVPLLPTRCWLSAPMPTKARGQFETEGWTVRPMGFGRRAEQAGPGASA